MIYQVKNPTVLINVGSKFQNVSQNVKWILETLAIVKLLNVLKIVKR